MYWNRPTEKERLVRASIKPAANSSFMLFGSQAGFAISPDGKRQISTDGGVQPSWRRDGKEVFYLGRDNKLMAAEVKTVGASMEIGKVGALFDAKTSRNRRLGV